MLLAVGTQLGPYEIAAPIGVGGMGEVYMARDPRLNRVVAIKISQEQFNERFEREARAVAALNHPNICTLYDVGPNYLVMEYIEGPTLAEQIKSALPLAEALAIARQIAEALEAAHDRGILHRDLKPTNIKLTLDGKVKVLDFGLAKALDSDAVAGNPTESPTLTISATRAGVILGTAAYMSPEQARGTALDKRADIWSYGVVLFEMLTGTQTFGGETISDTLAAVLRADVDWSALPSETPPNIRRLLRRCLERDRKRRLRDIGDARLELDEELPAPTIEATPKSSRLAWVVASLLLGVSIVLGLFALRDAPPHAGVQASILAPEKATFRPGVGSSGGMAISPDGRSLTFVAVQDGKTLLWLRRLDFLTARPLPGTENAYNPFWSPDGRSIAFFADPKLKKANVAGGPAQVICDATGGRGGTWNAEGTIVFALTRGLFRVPAEGGTAVPIAVRDSGDARYWPWFLPDGRHFLYSTRPDFARGAIVVGTLDQGPTSNKPIALMSASSNTMYAPGRGDKGWLLFAQQTTLFAQKFDARNLKLEGEAVPVAEHAGYIAGLGFTGFSVSQTGALVYSQDVGLNGTLVFLDRAGKRSPVAVATGGYQHPRLSPDGTKLAMSVADATGSADIWFVDLAHDSVLTRFTFNPAPDLFPVWSSDGKQIAFGSVRERGANIYLKAANGTGNDEGLNTTTGSVATYDWSRDGRYILHLSIGATTGPDLFVYDLKNRKDSPIVQTPHNESQGQFSPDGRWVAYSSDESTRYEVYVRSFADPPSRFQISTNGGGQPRWRGDGKELYYISEGKMMAVPVKASADTFERGMPRVLFEERALADAMGSGPQGFVYDVTRDGQQFVIIDRAGQRRDQPLTLITDWQAAVRK